MPRSPVLRTLAFIARVLGWIVIVLGALSFLVSLLSLLGISSSQGGSPLVVILVFSAEILIAAFGFSLIIFGEMIQVFLDTEENTRDSATRLRALGPPGEAPGRPSYVNAPMPPPPPTCPSCGAHNETGAKFCEQCGKPL